MEEKDWPGDKSAKPLSFSSNDSLNFSNCDMAPDQVIHFLKTQLIFRNIRALNLSRSNLGDDFVASLSNLLKCEKIVNLDLSWNNFTDKGVKSLIKSALDSSTNSIQFLNIEGNKIGRNGGISLASHIKKGSNLIQLVLNSCYLDQSHSILKESLKFNLTITTFDASTGNGSMFADDGDIVEILEINKYISYLHQHKFSKWKKIINTENPRLLTTAIQLGHLAATSYILNLQLDFSYRDEQDHPLNIAIKNRDINMVKVLLGNGFQVEEATFKHKMSKEILSLLNNRKRGILNLSQHIFRFISPELIDIRNITKIDLKRNHIEKIPSDFILRMVSMKDLTTLDISYNNVISIPDEICTLGNLTTLYANNNALESLPYNITRLKKLEVKNNFLGNSLAETASFNTEKLFETIRNSLTPSKKWEKLKVMVVGKKNVGKTHMIRNLMAQPYENESTQNVEVQNLELSSKSSKRVKLSIYDFGGQDNFYPTYSFYMTKQSLYIVVFSLKDESSQANVYYWLNIIKSASMVPCSIIIVGTHKSKSNSELMDDLKILYNKFYTNIKGYVSICNKTQEGINELLELIKNVSIQEPLVRLNVPSSFFAMSEIITKLRAEKRNYISWKAFREYGRSVNLYSEQVCIQCAEILHKSSSIIWYNQKNLKSIVVVDPQWLSGIMASLTCFKATVSDGILKHGLLSSAWKQYSSSIRKDLMTLLSKFEVLYSIRGIENASIVPSILPDICNQDIYSLFNTVADPEVIKIERTYKFNFYPLGLLEKLIVKLYHNPDIYCHSPYMKGLIVSPNSIAQNILKEGYDNQGLVEKSLAEGYEQAVINYYGGSGSISVLNILIYKKSNVDPFFNIFVKIIENIESILSTSFQKHAQGIERYVGYDTDFATLSDAVDFYLEGSESIQLKKTTVRIEDLAPDICLVDVRRIESAKIGPIIGEGNASVVYFGKVDGKAVAIKELKGDNISNHELFQSFQNEVTILKDLDHPNIVKLIGININKFQIYLEYVEGKDLYSLLHNPHIADFSLPLSLRIKIALDVAKGISYIQNLNPPLVHRDIRSPNIFICSLIESDEINVKLSDFGLSARVYSYFEEVLMSWNWMPPEAFGPDTAYYDEKVDVYSFAIVFWEILTRQIPFSEFSQFITEKTETLTEEQLEDRNLMDMIAKNGWTISGNVATSQTYNKHEFLDAISNQNLRPTIPDDVPIAIKVLIQRAWHTDPDKRPSMKKIVNLLEKILEKNVDITPTESASIIRELDTDSPWNSFKMNLNSSRSNDELLEISSDTFDEITEKIKDIDLVEAKESMRLSLNLARDETSLLEGREVIPTYVGPLLDSCRHMAVNGNSLYISTFDGYIHSYNFKKQKYLNQVNRRSLGEITALGSMNNNLWCATPQQICIYSFLKPCITLNYDGPTIIAFDSINDNKNSIACCGDSILIFENFEIASTFSTSVPDVLCMKVIDGYLWFGTNSNIKVYDQSIMRVISTIKTNGSVNTIDILNGMVYCHSFSRSICFKLSPTTYEILAEVMLSKIITCSEMVCSNNNIYVWCGVDNGDIHIIDFDLNRTVGVLKSHQDIITGLIKDEEQSTIWSCSQDGSVIAWHYY